MAIRVEVSRACSSARGRSRLFRCLYSDWQPAQAGRPPPPTAHSRPHAAPAPGSALPAPLHRSRRRRSLARCARLSSTHPASFLHHDASGAGHGTVPPDTAPSLPYPSTDRRAAPGSACSGRHHTQLLPQRGLPLLHALIYRVGKPPPPCSRKPVRAMRARLQRRGCRLELRGLHVALRLRSGGRQPVRGRRRVLVVPGEDVLPGHSLVRECLSSLYMLCC